MLGFDISWCTLVIRKMIQPPELLPKGKEGLVKAVCLLLPDSMPCVGSLLMVGQLGIQARTGTKQRTCPCHQAQHHHHVYQV